MAEVLANDFYVFYFRIKNLKNSSWNILYVSQKTPGEFFLLHRFTTGEIRRSLAWIEMGGQVKRIRIYFEKSNLWRLSFKTQFKIEFLLPVDGSRKVLEKMPA